MADWRSPLRRLKEALFGTMPGRTVGARRFGAEFLKRLTDGGIGVRELSDDDLMELVQYLLTNRSLRRPLQGNERFLSSVEGQYRKKGSISERQRTGILNVIERSYPHNLAAELRKKR